MCKSLILCWKALLLMNLMYIVVGCILFYKCYVDEGYTLEFKAFAFVFIAVGILGFATNAIRRKNRLYIYQIALLTFFLYMTFFVIENKVVAITVAMQEYQTKIEWKFYDSNQRKTLQDEYLCCGYDNNTTVTANEQSLHCDAEFCCFINNLYYLFTPSPEIECECPYCKEIMVKILKGNSESYSNVGLFFTLILIVGLLVTTYIKRYDIEMWS